MTVYVLLSMLIIIYALLIIGYKKNKILIWSGIVIALFIAAVILILTHNYIDGRLLSYEKDYIDSSQIYIDSDESEESEGFYYFNMDKDTINDFSNYPEKYTSYRIKIEITNMSDKKIYEVYAETVNKYENIWFDTNKLSYGFNGLEAYETCEYDDVLYVIVKTEGMSENEIDELLKIIKIKIHSTYIEYLNSIMDWEDYTLLYGKKVIGFEE